MNANFLNKNKPQLVDKDIRCKNFCEVSLGYDEETALKEAERCLNCKNKPCVTGCPVKIDIPAFISKVKEKNFEEAYKIIEKSSSLAAICGRVCPQENQCEGKCIRGIKGDSVSIGTLERFVADWHYKNIDGSLEKAKNNGHKIAIVGSGPSGLSCAGDLSKKGYDITVFEALHELGGVLSYGIPEFRLPKSVVKKEIDGLKKLGVKFETNMVIGKTISIDDLLEKGFEFIYIATGAGLPRFMNIPGESLKGVYSANELLTRVNLMKAYKYNADTPVLKAKNVAIVGGGNVAMDAARSYKRLGAQNVYVIYRRTENELPARREEVEHAKEEGIIFKFLMNPKKILGDECGFVKSIECAEMYLGEPDESGRRRPLEKEGSNITLDVDAVVMSIGTSPNPLIKNTTFGLKTNGKGGIIVDKFGKTSLDKLYAGGDAVTGAATVILAMEAGKIAADAIDVRILNKI